MTSWRLGFSAGLLRLRVLPLVLAVAAQAFLLTQVGLLIGARAGARFRDATESLAGVALVALSALLFIERLS